ncbi:nucleoside triphosphate pyrophosphohydrolase family protein [Pseudoflavonifractor sp. 524-17]|uniref:nucleoside triphosphate pyrophosphohydrolase family protein n=1 Tax=Pseudoflavonifractor sp. 524-17 TaxID=2304577 RepID=UPI001FAC1066|nr:nucleoside triphosphate pyrophosphohydrolase family protein [Pseudoflavonifractor sp. 524-17]
MSCRYKDQCPNYSAQCKSPMQDFSCCVSFLVAAYENEKRRMTPNEYQRLAMRTCNIPHEQKQDMLMHSVLGLASEAGEVAGIFQKKYQGHKIDPEHLEKEIGDCLWMIAEACTALGWKMETVMQTNIEKLKARYPNGFEPERSLYRRAGDD